MAPPSPSPAGRDDPIIGEIGAGASPSSDTLEALEARRRGKGLSPSQAQAWYALSLGARRYEALFDQARQWLAEGFGGPELLAWHLAYVGQVQVRRLELAAAIAKFRGAIEVLMALPPIRLEPPPAPPPRPRLQLEEALWRTLAAAAAAGVRAFPYAGVLLGLVRERGLIEGDRDLDIAAPVHELEPLDRVLRDEGWQPRRPHLPYSNYRVYAHERLGVALDVCGFVLDEAGGKLLNGFFLEGQPASHQRILEFPAASPLVRRSGALGPVWMLGEPEAWVELIYGPDWRIPDPTFDTVVSAHNLRAFSELVQCYAYARIAQRAMSGDYRRAASLARQAAARSADELFARCAAHFEPVGGGA